MFICVQIFNPLKLVGNYTYRHVSQTE